LLTTVFPKSAFENLLWSSIFSPVFFWVLCVFKVFCDGIEGCVRHCLGDLRSYKHRAKNCSAQNN
jgi:hypothetical protein